MKRKEVIHYLINNELMKEKAFSNVKEQLIKKKIEKLMNTKGTYEYNLYELYSMYYEEEEEQIRNELGRRILKFVPEDYDIKSDEIYYSKTSVIEKIKGQYEEKKPTKLDELKALDSKVKLLLFRHQPRPSCHS